MHFLLLAHCWPLLLVLLLLLLLVLLPPSPSSSLPPQAATTRANTKLAVVTMFANLIGFLFSRNGRACPLSDDRQGATVLVAKKEAMSAREGQARSH